MLSCVCPFQTLHLLWTRNNPLTELVLQNQHVLSFMKSMSAIFSINTRQRMTPFHLSPFRYFLTYFLNLPSLIFHVCLHPQMHPLLITRKTHQMLVQHSTTERIRYSMKTHLIFHFFLGNTEGEFVRFSSTPLFVSFDHEDADEIIDFVIAVVVIHLFPYLIMIMTLS